MYAQEAKRVERVFHVIYARNEKENLLKLETNLSISTGTVAVTAGFETKAWNSNITAFQNGVNLWEKLIDCVPVSAPCMHAISYGNWDCYVIISYAKRCSR